MWRPNITGYSAFRSNAIPSLDQTGAFSANFNGNSDYELGLLNTHAKNNFYFNASNSNSVYTDNGKVYPASLALNYIIKC